jgi:hypothetical protein
MRTLTFLGHRAALADLWKSLVAGMFDRYRPERHYMRGPGPKWHAKHAANHHVRISAEDLPSDQLNARSSFIVAEATDVRWRPATP